MIVIYDRKTFKVQATTLKLVPIRKEGNKY